MAFLIDTNVISEIQKGRNASVEVQRWYEDVDRHDIFISVLVIGELRIGIERLRRHNRDQAQVLEQRMKRLDILMGKRILPVTQAIVERWA